jgi:hypothetical protein
VEQVAAEQQAGFSSGRGTVNHLFVTGQLTLNSMKRIVIAPQVHNAFEQASNLTPERQVKVKVNKVKAHPDCARRRHARKPLTAV